MILLKRGMSIGPISVKDGVGIVVVWGTFTGGLALKLVMDDPSVTITIAIVSVIRGSEGT